MNLTKRNNLDNFSMLDCWIIQHDWIELMTVVTIDPLGCFYHFTQFGTSDQFE